MLPFIVPALVVSMDVSLLLLLLLLPSFVLPFADGKDNGVLVSDCDEVENGVDAVNGVTVDFPVILPL